MTFHSDSNPKSNIQGTTFNQNHENSMLVKSGSTKSGKSQHIATKTKEIVVAIHKPNCRSKKQESMLKEYLALNLPSAMRAYKAELAKVKIKLGIQITFDDVLIKGRVISLLGIWLFDQKALINYNASFCNLVSTYKKWDIRRDINSLITGLASLERIKEKYENIDVEKSDRLRRSSIEEKSTLDVYGVDQASKNNQDKNEAYSEVDEAETTFMNIAKLNDSRGRSFKQCLQAMSSLVSSNVLKSRDRSVFMVSVNLNSQDASACFGIGAGNARQIKRRVLEKLQNFCDQHREGFDDLKTLCEQLKERSH